MEAHGEVTTVQTRTIGAPKILQSFFILKILNKKFFYLKTIFSVTPEDVLGCPTMASNGLFGFMGVFPISRFVYFWYYRSEIVSDGFCIFFCVVFSFFTSLRYEIVLSLSLHFFVVVIMDVLFCCS